MKNFYVFSVLLLSGLLSKAQDGISFDNLQFGRSLMTEDAVYFNSNKLVKSDYLGNIIWSKTGFPVNSPFKIKDGYIYIHILDGITKLDTAGNFIWTINYHQPLCIQSSVPNNIADIVINGSKIFVLLNQEDAGGIDYPSIITLDTSGTVLNSWCGYYLQRTTFVKGIENNSGAAWIVAHDGGNVHTGLSIPLDTNGNLNSGASFNFYQYGQFNLTQLILKKNNSTHCYFVNSFSTGNPAYPYIIFESDTGTGLSHHGYSIPSLPYGMDFITACKDTSDNFYILGTGYTGDIVLFKTDPNGNVLISGGWTAGALSAYQLEFPFPGFKSSMIFRNDSVYITCKVDNKLSMIAVDSMLNSTCFTPDLNIFIGNSPNISLGDSISVPEVPVSIQGTNTNLLTQNIFQANGSKICYTTSIHQPDSHIPVIVYPNPAGTEVFIRCETNDIQFELFTVTGQLMKVPSEKTVDGLKLNVSDLDNGMYILKNNTHDQISRKSIIIYH